MATYANTTPIFPYVPRISWAGITTANVAKGGTVAIGASGFGASFTNVFTAGQYGSRIDQIKVRSLGLNASTVLRLFVQDSAATTNTLVHETTLASVGASVGNITITNQSVAGNTFGSSATHGMSVGSILFVSTTSTLTALSASTAYYVTSVSGASTFTLATLAGSTVTVGSTVSSASAVGSSYTNLETSAQTDYDITISKNTSETAPPIPYLPASYKLLATVGTIGATPANMGWEVTVFGGDY